MTNRKRPTIKVTDESQDQKYFTITPRLIWALSRNPYDYTFWATIKGIAGDAGECYLATPDLAILAMMSTGQASDSRKHWIRLGLLSGAVIRDPGYPQPVWHLKIPNIWAANLEWAEKYPSIKERVEFKQIQKELLQTQRAEKRLHLVKPSPGEGGIPPGEGGHTPDETKDIKKDIQKESVPANATTPTGMINPNTGNHTDTVVKGDPMDGMIFFGQRAAEIDSELQDRIHAFPPDCFSTLSTLIQYFKWPASTIPEDLGKKGGKFAQWIMEIREINSQVGSFGQRGVLAACKASKDITISHPAGINWAIAGELGKLTNQFEQKQLVAQPINTPFALSLKNKVSPETDERMIAMRKKLNQNS